MKRKQFVFVNATYVSFRIIAYVTLSKAFCLAALACNIWNEFVSPPTSKMIKFAYLFGGMDLLQNAERCSLCWRISCFRFCGTFGFWDGRVVVDWHALGTWFCFGSMMAVAPVDDVCGVNWIGFVYFFVLFSSIVRLPIETNDSNDKFSILNNWWHFITHNYFFYLSL